ncbi:hypothetical protein Sste5344_001205 [Sporothrix stenoceras]
MNKFLLMVADLEASASWSAPAATTAPSVNGCQTISGPAMLRERISLGERSTVPRISGEPARGVVHGDGDVANADIPGPSSGLAHQAVPDLLSIDNAVPSSVGMVSSGIDTSLDRYGGGKKKATAQKKAAAQKKDALKSAAPKKYASCS